MERIAVVGDIHGGADQLAEVLAVLRPMDRKTIMLGDYVNYGPKSFAVIERLITEKQTQRDGLVLLAGNHDLEMLKVVRGGNLAPFLAMGGAATIKSYVSEPLVGNVAELFRSSVPESHERLLGSLDEAWSSEDYVARHKWPLAKINTLKKFVVMGHYLQVNGVPLILPHAAYIDTGCGSMPDGKLTCLLLPEMEWFSV